MSLPRAHKQIKGQIDSIKFLKNQNQKHLENFKKSKGKMSVRVNVRMSKIMRTPIKIMRTPIVKSCNKKYKGTNSYL